MNNLEIIGVSVAGIIVLGGLVWFNNSENKSENKKKTHNSISRSPRFQRDPYERSRLEFDKNLYKSLGTTRKTEGLNNKSGTRRKIFI